MTEADSVNKGQAGPGTAVERVRVRYLIIACLIPIVWLPGADILFIAMADTPWYWLDIALIYYMQGLLAIALALTFYFWRFPPSETLGPPADGPGLRSGLLWAAFLFIISMPAVYIVFYPLSFLAPEFVDYRLIDLSVPVYFDSGIYPFIPNLLDVISLCVIAPILEELAFRGVILHRWAHRFGLGKAVLFSSLLFGIAHTDVLGAFLFGIGMCILYLRFQSLWVPIISHGVYNFVAWLFALGNFLQDDPSGQYTLQDFQNEWWIAAIYAAIGAVWATIYLIRRRPDRRLRLPALTG